MSQVTVTVQPDINETNVTVNNEVVNVQVTVSPEEAARAFALQAEAAALAAEVSEDNAAASAAAALSSEQAADLSESNAAASAGTAATQAGIATTQAGNALTSANAAAASASAALGSENAAAGSASAALASENTATTQAGIATAQAGIATTQAGNALTSANNAAASASAAAQVGTSTLLTGYTVGPNTPIAATDTILQAFGEVQGQINARVSSNIYSANGTLASARVLTLGGFSLDFSGTTTSRFFANGNVGISTTTDAGFRLDVNGSARVQGDLTTNLTAGRVPFIGVSGVLSDNVNFLWDNTNSILSLRGSSVPPMFILDNSSTAAGIYGLEFRRTGVFEASITHNRFSGDLIINTGRSVGWGGDIRFITDTVEKWTILSVGILQSNGAQVIRTSTGLLSLQNAAGNVTIGGSVDAGFRLDVNGTARVQNKLSVGTPTAASAVMEVTSTTQGFLPPRMTAAQRNAIVTPAAGLMVYNTTDNRPSFFNGTIWINL